jgi:periplasmic protein TonB
LPHLRALLFVLTLLIAGLACAADGIGEPVLDMGPGITAPRVTHQVNPVYKDEEGFRITGSVIVGLVVSSRGEPKDVHVVHSLEKAVDQSAVEAVQQWQFEAARKNGEPVAVRITVEIRFHSL